MSEKKIDPLAFNNKESSLYVIKNTLTNICSNSGIDGGFSEEIQTNYDRATSENVIKGTKNCYIILGYDRDSGRSSGLGGRGHTGTSTIDIIAGHMGSNPIDELYGEKQSYGKDFKKDSARIYISQRTKIDEYFGIPKIAARLSNPTQLEESNNKSGLGLKADTVRLIARDSIKIVTSHKQLNSVNIPPDNSGIDIIAGYNIMKLDPYLDLQPMVKGDNLIALLKEIVLRIEGVQSTVANFMDIQKKVNDVFIKHKHQSHLPGFATSEIIGDDASLKSFELLTKTLPGIIESFTRSASIDGTYFSPTNPKYINSMFNRVN